MGCKLDDRRTHTKRCFELSIIETGVGTAIITSLIAFVLPAVHSARLARETWSKSNWFEEWLASQPAPFFLLLPIACTLIVLGGLLLLRRLLPISYKKHVVWKPTQPRVTLEDLPKLEWDWPANVSSLLVPAGSAMIVAGFTHLRADRRQRRPIITWEGPLGPFSEIILWAGFWAITVSLLIAMFSFVRCETRHNQRAALFSLLGFGVLFFTVMIWCGVTED